MNAIFLCKTRVNVFKQPGAGSIRFHGAAVRVLPRGLWASGGTGTILTVNVPLVNSKLAILCRCRLHPLELEVPEDRLVT